MCLCGIGGGRGRGVGGGSGVDGSIVHKGVGRVVDILMLGGVFMVEVVEGVELVVWCVLRRVVRLVLRCENGKGIFFVLL